MIIYNVTVKIDNDVHDEWLQWMKEVHVPDVMKTSLFVEYKICRVIKHEDDGTTYAIQYTCKDMATLHKYQVNHAPALQTDHTKKYKDKFVAFRTLMEIID